MNRFKIICEGNFIFIICRECGDEQPFNDGCFTSQLEAQHRAEIELYKREHVCAIRRAA